MGGGGGGDIVPGQQAFPLPQPAVHHQLAQLCQVLRLDIQAPPALFDASGAGLPVEVRDAHGGEQPLPQKAGEAFPRDPADNGGEHIGVQAVVGEFRSRLPFGPGAQEAADPVRLRQGLRLGEGHAGAHGEQVLHRHALEPAVEGGASRILEEVRRLVLDGQRAVVRQQADGQRHHALAGGEGILGGPQVLRAVGRLADNMPAAQDHDALAVQLPVPAQLLQKGLDVPGGYPLALRRDPWEGLGDVSRGDRGLFRLRGQEGLGGRADVQYAGQQLEGAAGGGKIHCGILLGGGVLIAPTIPRKTCQINRIL